MRKTFGLEGVLVTGGAGVGVAELGVGVGAQAEKNIAAAIGKKAYELKRIGLSFEEIEASLAKSRDLVKRLVGRKFERLNFTPKLKMCRITRAIGSNRRARMKFNLVMATLMGFLAACGSTPAQPPAPTATVATAPTIVAPAGYRPIQSGDRVEGATISYQYILPSLEHPVVVIAFGTNLIQLVSIKPELGDGLVEYAQDLAKEGKSIYAFDENDPTQKEPRPMTWETSKPIEIVFIPLTEGSHSWSVTETQGGEVQAAYKIIRRKDGGLRFVDAYGLVALNSANNMFTLNGGGTGLVFSSRLALLRLILADAKYQRGENLMASFPPEFSQYDPRILKLDPSRTGLAMDKDWVLFSRPGPNPGLTGP